jgi:hypothetical protein
LIGAAILVLTACGQDGEDGGVSRLDGDFRTAYVGEPYFMTAKQVDATAIARLIGQRFPGRSDPLLSNRELAERIVIVSECFDLETALLTGLVRQESAFQRGAVSATGASGLTQFTTIAVRESNDQLGERGAAQARATTIHYFTGRLDECVAPRLGLARWAPLWERVPGDLRTMRNHFRESADDALVYGAVLLKTLLSVARTVQPTAETSDLYVKALERYNGDPDPAVRDDYWRRIFRYAEEARNVGESEP